jgi:capsular polysaccharide biosynthesis protein
MPLTEYLRLARRRGWIVVLVALLTALSAFVFSRLQTPVYKSTVYLLVQPARTDFGLTQSAKTLLRSYVAWMDTDRNAARVIDALQLDRTPQDLRADVEIASDDSRFVIQIDVEDEIGDQANDIARKWAELFVQWRQDENLRQRREDQVDGLILDEPRYALDRPKTGINVAAGAILGALLGGVIVFVLEWNEAGVIRSPADVERFLGMPVVGIIPPADAGPDRRKAAGQAAPRPAEAAR